MIYRGPGFLAVVWFGSSALLPSVSSTSDTQDSGRLGKETTCWREGRGGSGRSQIIRQYEGLSFNTLSSPPSTPPPLSSSKRSEGKQKSFERVEKIPPHPHWDRRAIERNSKTISNLCQEALLQITLYDVTSWSRRYFGSIYIVYFFGLAVKSSCRKTWSRIQEHNFIEVSGHYLESSQTWGSVWIS